MTTSDEFKLALEGLRRKGYSVREGDGVVVTKERKAGMVILRPVDGGDQFIVPPGRTWTAIASTQIGGVVDSHLG